MAPSRRSLLRTVGFSLTGGALASLSGCVGDSPAAGTGGTTDDPTTTATSSESTDASDESKPSGDLPKLAEWLPSPANTPFYDGYGVEYYDIAAIESRKDALHENAYERLTTEAARSSNTRKLFPDYDLAPLDAVLDFGRHAEVAFGSFDTDALQDQLSGVRGTYDDGEEHTGTHLDRYRGFDLYDIGAVLAVSEDAIVTPGWLPEEARPYVEAILDAKAGEIDRYADTNDYVSAMLGLVDDPHALTCYPEAMGGNSTRGFRADEITGGLKSWRFGAETTHLTYANTYPDAESATAEKLQGYIDSESDRFGSFDGLDAQQNGGTVWATGTTPTGEFDHLSPGGPGDGVHTSN
ncbi:hypothetical protein [Haloarchaeobius sp. DFWS5]|uniref:hypothetical protein n=1 Tax=Haloarchaeobius sp. DFWS5 TaxID=3446114 RepID=UPI003EBB3541